MTTSTARYRQRETERRMPKDTFDLMYNLLMGMTPKRQAERQLVIPTKHNGSQIFLPKNELHDARVSSYKTLLYNVNRVRQSMLPKNKSNIVLEISDYSPRADIKKLHASVRNLESRTSSPAVTLELTWRPSPNGSGFYQARTSLCTNLDSGVEVVPNDTRLGRNSHVYNTIANEAADAAYQHLRLQK